MPYLRGTPIVQLTLLGILLLLGCGPKIDLYHQVKGQGETLVFIHGFQEDYRVFEPQLELLSDTYQVVTYSRRYNYPNTNSQTHTPLYSPFTEAQDLESLRQTLGVAKMHLVGHSYGGLVALAYAQQYPQQLYSLTVSEPPLLFEEACTQSLANLNNQLLEPIKEPLKARDTVQAMAVLFTYFVGKDIQDQAPPEVVEALAANLGEVEALAHAQNPFPKIETVIPVPALAITTGKTLPLLQCSNPMLRADPEFSEQLHLETLSHEMWTTNPELMAGHLRRFLASVK